MLLPQVPSMLCHPFGRRQWDAFQGNIARPGRWWGARGNWKQRASPPEVMLALARRTAALTWKHKKWQMVTSNCMSRWVVVLTWTHKQLVLKSWMILSLEVVDLLFVQSLSFLGLSVTITATTTYVSMILYVVHLSTHRSEFQPSICWKYLFSCLYWGLKCWGFWSWIYRYFNYHWWYFHHAQRSFFLEIQDTVISVNSLCQLTPDLP